jgi:hypothetical protein
MTTLASAPARVNPSNITLTDIPQVVPARHAAGFIRRARYVGLIVTTGPGGAWEIFDAPKRRVLRMVRRRDRVWISEVFGTVIIGRPEPVLADRSWPEDILASLDSEPPAGPSVETAA